MTSVVISNVQYAAASRLQLAASRLQLTASTVCAVCAQLTTTLKINIANKFCENMLHELTLSVNEVFSSSPGNISQNSAYFLLVKFGFYSTPFHITPPFFGVPFIWNCSGEMFLQFHWIHNIL